MVHKWAFTIDIRLDPITGKRKQKVKSGFNTKQETVEYAASLIHEVSQRAETDKSFQRLCNRVASHLQ